MGFQQLGKAFRSIALPQISIKLWASRIRVRSRSADCDFPRVRALLLMQPKGQTLHHQHAPFKCGQPSRRS